MDQSFWPAWSCSNSTVPTYICVTTQIPDIVMINCPQKIAILTERTMWFQTNFEKSAQRKENIYGSLLNDRQSIGFTCELITIEVGCRGLVSWDNKAKLIKIYSYLNGSKKTSHCTKNKLSRTSVLASYAIFYSKYASEWIDPPLITWCLYGIFFINVYVSENVFVKALPRRSGGIMLQPPHSHHDTWVWNVYLFCHIIVNVFNTE